MATQHRRRLWVMLGTIAILVVICGMGAQQVFQALAQPPSAAPFLAARARWQQRPFQQYRLVISRHELGAACRQTLDVAGLAIETVVENTCTMPFTPSPQTIDQLLADLESYALTYRCGPNGCGCDWLALSATYHPAWGYPQQVRLQQKAAAWWQGLIHGKFFCTLIGASDSDYTIDELIPVQIQP